MHYKKLIKKWAKLRHPDPNFAEVAIAVYKDLSESDKESMLKEFKDYIDAVKSGKIDPTPIELPKPMIFGMNYFEPKNKR